MHDLDRVMFEGGGELAGEGPHQEFLELLGEAGGGGPGSQVREQSMDSRETQLATELLEISDEAELEQFLGSLVRRAAGAATRFATSPTGQALGGILKDAAKKALPVVGGAIGNAVAPGGQGAVWGRRVGTAAGDLFGLELEGLSAEDRELEVARSFVRFADAAARTAARAGQSSDPLRAARAAVATAARAHAPGLYARMRAPGVGSPAASGVWERRGAVVVLHGA